MSKRIRESVSSSRDEKKDDEIRRQRRYRSPILQERNAGVESISMELSSRSHPVDLPKEAVKTNVAGADKAQKILSPLSQRRGVCDASQDKKGAPKHSPSPLLYVLNRLLFPYIGRSQSDITKLEFSRYTESNPKKSCIIKESPLEGGKDDGRYRKEFKPEALKVTRQNYRQESCNSVEAYAL